MLGLREAATPRLSTTVRPPYLKNGPREHYMRARVEHGKLSLFDNQDSSLLSILSDANALLVVPPSAPERPAGTAVEYIPI